MHCSECQTANDADALFCASCGKALGVSPVGGPPKQRRAYLYALLLVPVVLIAVGIGYYKYFLPDGIAAVVNGEEIKLSDLDALVRVQGGNDAQHGALRHQVLNQLITERLIMQEVRNAGTKVSKMEVEKSVADARLSSGLGDAAFRNEVTKRYGSMAAFQAMLKRRLLMNAFLSERVVPAGADPQSAQAAINQWFAGISGKAIVRVALAEQGAGPGCGGCGQGNGCGQMKTGCGQGQQGRGCATGQKAPASPEKMKSAGDAGLRYWREKYGTDAITIKPRDFGCHIQVDVFRNDTIIGSLRFQDGTITEVQGGSQL